MEELDPHGASSSGLRRLPTVSLIAMLLLVTAPSGSAQGFAAGGLLDAYLDAVHRALTDAPLPDTARTASFHEPPPPWELPSRRPRLVEVPMGPPGFGVGAPGDPLLGGLAPFGAAAEGLGARDSAEGPTRSPRRPRSLATLPDMLGD